MNDNARNTRTLIVSFVFAIMALIPLRFVEVGQMMSSSSQVLGDQMYAGEVVLPVDELGEQGVLEAPYNELETEQVLGQSSDCLPTEDGLALLSEYEGRLSEGGLDGVTTDRMVSEMIQIESAMCK